MTEQLLQDFLTAYLAGSLSPSLMSEPVDSSGSQSDGGIVRVVGSTFHDMCVTGVPFLSMSRQAVCLWLSVLSGITIMVPLHAICCALTFFVGREQRNRLA